VTDTDWYGFLSERPDLTEVNFWNPSGRPLMSLEVGAPFIFKSRAAVGGRLVGGGYFNAFLRLALSDAWRIFGPANGVPSLAALRGRIAKYRREDPSVMGDPEIGCTLLNNVGFLRAEDQPPAPESWGAGLVRGKSYEGVEAESLVETTLRRILTDRGMGPDSILGPVFGADHLAPTRIGQRSFQALVLDAYHRRCAITGERIRPVLQAAHIFPVSDGGENRVDNALLLRSDVHTLFDQGYISVDPAFKIRISPRIRSEFNNGAEYYRLDGSVIDLPDRPVNRPNREFLEWHNDVRFLAS